MRARSDSSKAIYHLRRSTSQSRMLAARQRSRSSDQLAVDQTMKVFGGVGEVHRDDAVLGLADGTAPLPLDAGCLVSFLHVTRFVDHADAVGRDMIGDTISRT